MSFYIRYVLTDDQPVTWPELDQAMQQNNPGYALDGEILLLDEEEYGRIEINAAGDGDDIFEDDIRLLEEFAARAENKEKLLSILESARSMVTVQPIWQERDEEETLKALSPLFGWLLANRAGILVEEGGHFSDLSGPID